MKSYRGSTISFRLAGFRSGALHVVGSGISLKRAGYCGTPEICSGREDHGFVAEEPTGG